MHAYLWLYVDYLTNFSFEETPQYPLSSKTVAQAFYQGNLENELRDLQMETIDYSQTVMLIPAKTKLMKFVLILSTCIPLVTTQMIAKSDRGVDIITGIVVQI